MGQNIQNKFNAAENEIRLAIMEFILNEGRPFNITNDGFLALSDIKLSTAGEFTGIMETLASRDGLVADEEQNVNFIYPVSALITNHKVTLADGRSFCAMCAIDAIGAAFTFHQDTEVRSACSVCGEEVYVKMQGEKVVEHYPEKLHALTFKLEEIANWASSC